MRNDAIELGFHEKMRARRDAKRSWHSTRKGKRVSAAAPKGPAVDAIDEAFAGLPRFNSVTAPMDTERSGRPARVDANPGPINFALVKQLTCQLDALDRQREQLAQLLREIEVAPLAE